jgi:hypothetical protein
LINAATKQPPGGLWLILDEAIRKHHAATEFPPSYMLRPQNLRHANVIRYFRVKRTAQGKTVMAIDGFRFARDRGAVVLEAPTIEKLAARLAEHGVDEQAVIKTVSDYNAAIDGDSAVRLAVPKGRFAYRIERAPLYALKVAAGVSMTYGGIAINERAEVLDENDRAIPGLYAVPGTAGGVHKTHYGGALAACGVFGMIAGEQSSALSTSSQ